MVNYKTLAMIIIFSLLFSSLAVISTTSSEIIKSKESLNDDFVNKHSNSEAELDLLHAVVNFNILALAETTSPFNISYSVPPIYGYQSPVLFELKNNTNNKILSYQIINDDCSPNKKVRFSIAPMKKDENISFHFDCWVLVKNNNYNDLPSYVEKPVRFQLPKETKKWLRPTLSIQSNRLRIKLAAWVLQGFDRNIIDIADKIADFTANTIDFDVDGHQDALSTLKNGYGVCTGKANLGTALFRALGIPAKDLAVIPTWYNRTDMHYISEYYCPGYGWIFTETALGITPFEPKGNIVMRINYPNDENKAFFKGGVEFWHWSENPKIIFTNTGPLRRAWIEKEIFTDEQNASLAFNLTKNVYNLHTTYVGMNLTKENLIHYDNAILAQKNAIKCFNQNDNSGYLDNMTFAYNEYIMILE